MNSTDTAARAEAFGAIRRAVKVARGNDKEAANHGKIAKRMLEQDPDCIYVGHNKTYSEHRRSEYVYKQRAASVRFAIRAAIKSPWLMIEPGMSRRDP